MRWKKTATCLLVALALLVPMAPAGAVNEYLCEGVPPSGFDDVASISLYAPFIDCLLDWGVTSGTGPGTYSPAAPVDRWQMALFLMNVWRIVAHEPTGTPQGFTDIAGLSAEAQVAINQVGQLSITTGVATGLYGPNAQVTRWQMAIFLSRFAASSGIPLPGTVSTGFTDIGGLSGEAQNAISIVKSLGITSGTSATTFSPNDVVTREQMAAFLIRSLQVTFSLSTAAFAASCSVSGDVETCTGTGTWWAGVPLRFRQGFFVELPGDLSAVDSSETRIDFSLDGVVQTSSASRQALTGIVFRNWTVDLATGLTGEHVLEARYYVDGALTFVDTVTMTFE